MRRSDLTVLATIGGLLLLAAFWLLILSPKRNQASALQSKADDLRAQLQQDQGVVQSAEAARKGFDQNYRRLVVLGKAVPQDADTPSLLVQIQSLADRSGVDFRAIDLGESSSSSAPPPTPSTGPSGVPVPPTSTGSTTSTDTAGTATTTPGASASAPSAASATPPATGTGDTSTAVTSTPTAGAPTTSALPTESSAASLPIGASVGPAGLPTMPYDLKFRGDFFEIAKFIAGVDDLVHARNGAASVSGRLITINGLAVNGAAPKLTADLSVTTYVTPFDQGTLAGASQSGPAPAAPGAPPAVPTAAATTAAPTSTATPAPTP